MPSIEHNCFRRKAFTKLANPFRAPKEVVIELQSAIYI